MFAVGNGTISRRGRPAILPFHACRRPGWRVRWSLFVSPSIASMCQGNRGEVCVERLVEGQRAAGARRSTRPLIPALRDGVRDLVAPQPAATARIAVPLIGTHPVGTCSQPSPPAGAWHPDALQHRDQLGAIVALPRRDDDGERPPLPITGHVELGRQPAPTAPESLVAGMLDPLFLVGPTGPAPRPARVLMRAGDRGIDAYLPHHLPRRIRARLHAGENPDPGAVAASWPFSFPGSLDLCVCNPRQQHVDGLISSASAKLSEALRDGLRVR
jgi:hypothetical protein